jgi:hypothetical protein
MCFAENVMSVVKMTSLRLVILVGCLVVPVHFVAAGAPGPFKLTRTDDAVTITRGGSPVAEYVFRDAKIPRPYFAHLHARTGTTPVSRRHPPRAGIDPIDHAEFHPGLWWSFGDLNGVDFWRNKGRVELVRFITEPEAELRRARFAVEDRWLAPDGSEVCRGTMACEVVGGEVAKPYVPGTILLLEYTLRREGQPLVFGPQHEMGLGFRVATPFMVKEGTGRILGDHGGTNEAGNWGRTGSWWDYSGEIGDGVARRRAGILAVAASDNPRPVWAHARDYGFVALNPTGPPPDRKDVPSLPFTIPAGETFQMRFGVVLHSAPVGNPLDPKTASSAVGELLRDWTPNAP